MGERATGRYGGWGGDVLAAGSDGTTWRRPRLVPEVAAEAGLVVECAGSGFCGAVVGLDRDAGGAVVLEDRDGVRRRFALEPAAFLLDGAPVTLTPPRAASRPELPRRTASGSVPVELRRARVARASRILVEGRHDAELVEKVWGDDLRVEGVVVELLDGVDHLAGAVRAFAPGSGRRLGVLVDHLVPGSKESRLATQVSGPHVLVLGHPYVDVWQAVRPELFGLDGWPEVPRGVPWKQGVLDALGWPEEPPAAWRRILAAVRSYTDLDPSLLGRVEELIDFVTGGDAS